MSLARHPFAGTTPRAASAAIRVMIVDDSLTVRTIFKRMVESDPALVITGTASSAEGAIAQLAYSLMPNSAKSGLTVPGSMPGYPSGPGSDAVPTPMGPHGRTLPRLPPPTSRDPNPDYQLGAAEDHWSARALSYGGG